MRDLIVLCADQDTSQGFKTLLDRGPNLGFRAIDFQMVRHVNRDSGVFREAHDFLRPQCTRFSYALAVCDLEGCGRETTHRREQVEELIETRLQSNGWEKRSVAIVIAPELESWVWGDWGTLASHVEWPNGEAGLRAWLTERNLIRSGQAKPDRPKEGLDRILRQTKRRPSSLLFAALGSLADPKSCSDPAFAKLVAQLHIWFPPR